MPRTWLAAVVLAHLAVNLLHGLAHGEAHVDVSGAAAVFIVVVIFAGPLVGLAVSWRAPRLGGWIVATTLAGALVFGVIEHFVRTSPDHVAQVAGPWRSPFAATAVLLAVTEALGVALALRLVSSASRPRGSTRGS